MIDKKKAIICTVLYATVIVGALTGSVFIRNEELGIGLYTIIMYITQADVLQVSILKVTHRKLLKSILHLTG